MKKILKNIPILGFLLRWFYNLLHLNNLKFIIVLQQTQINDQQTQINDQQTQINELNSQIQVLFGHNHVHHENYKKIQETIKQQVSRQISYHSILFHQKIDKFIEEVKESAKTQEELIELQGDSISFVLDDYYLSFEETFRGSREVIRQRYMQYLKYLNPTIKKALDIGCGRGEWIEILQQNGIDAHGIDLNFAMLNSAKACRVKNLQKIDAFAFFKTCPDNTFDLVTAFHVIEHIPFEKLFLFLQEIKRVATPNALILLETPNPANLLVGAYTFYKDPTHLNPLPSEVVEFMLDYIGFSNLQTHFLHPYSPIEHIAEDSVCASRVNNYFYGAQDYLITATNFKPLASLLKQESSQKPKLAYVSPFPPLKTGIASYSASLISYLSQYYDIELILSHENISIISDQPFIIHSDDWFINNHHLYDRVLYHFGNSSFHTYMINLLASIPGIVVLHDFYLSGAMSKEHIIKKNDLYRLHGYRALMDLQQTSTKNVEWKYPCNKEVLKNALSIITHSEYSKTLASYWYSDISSVDFYTVPHLQKSIIPSEMLLDKKMLNLSVDAFTVCSFGMIGESKKTLSIIDAWLNTSLSRDPHCYLIFVGENDTTRYAKDVEQAISAHKNIYITGWTDERMFNSYLSIADMAVQLRTLSRGETSGALLDCLNYGIPTIANANGSMAEFPSDVLYMLEDEFAIKDLTQAFESLYHDKQKSQILSKKAKAYMKAFHNPKNCAAQYAKVIEETYASPQHRAQEIDNISKATSLLSFDALKQKQIFIDVSSISKNDLKTGIERVVRSHIRWLIDISPINYRIEPVYLTHIDGEYSYFYARSYTADLLKLEDFTLPDEPICLNHGDIFYGVDLCVAEVENAVSSGLYDSYKNLGVKFFFLVYDLLPISKPHFFPPYMKESHIKWLQNITDVADELICISQSVADEVTLWIKTNKKEKLSTLKVSSFHLGADIQAVSSIQKKNKKRPVFLMVGTIEPRKGHAQTLAAFELLWEQNIDINLTIVGKKGWMVDSFIQKLTTHPKLNKNLKYLEFVEDEELSKLYATSDALIAASEAEGFGLPLIEAARHKLSIIARDIPVFREVASSYAYYFKDSNDAQELALCIKNWLKLYERDSHPSSDDMPFLSWQESTKRLQEILK